MNLQNLLILSGILFCIGLWGALSKRNIITILMCIEIMFNAVNIALVALSRYALPALQGQQGIEAMARSTLTGQVFAVFVITVAAAEVALGLGIVIALYRARGTVDVGEANLMKR